MGYVDIAIVSFFALWAVCSVLRCGQRMVSKLFLNNASPPEWFGTMLMPGTKLKLLGKWEFFSGSGGWHDYYLYARGFRDDCTFTEWKDINPKGRDGKVVFYEPSRRLARHIRKAGMKLVAIAAHLEDPKELIKFPEYHILLDFAKLSVEDPAVERIQFLVANCGQVVMESKARPPADFEAPDRHVQYVSPFHLLRPQVAESRPSRQEKRLVRNDYSPSFSPKRMALP